jgi:hypothetical protein
MSKITMKQLKEIIKKNKKKAKEAFTEFTDFEEINEIDALKDEIQALKDKCDYLAMAQYYTATVKRHLTSREIDALQVLAFEYEFEAPSEWVDLVKKYNKSA